MKDAPGYDPMPLYRSSSLPKQEPFFPAFWLKKGLPNDRTSSIDRDGPVGSTSLVRERPGLFRPSECGICSCFVIDAFWKS